jgi:hypothetical protein
MPSGFSHVEAETPYDVLGWFLEQDVQSSIPWGRELVKMIENVQSVQDSYWKGTGNAHTFILTGKGVRIDYEYVAPLNRVHFLWMTLKVRYWHGCNFSRSLSSHALTLDTFLYTSLALTTSIYPSRAACFSG